MCVRWGEGVGQMELLTKRVGPGRAGSGEDANRGKDKFLGAGRVPHTWYSAGDPSRFNVF